MLELRGNATSTLCSLRASGQLPGTNLLSNTNFIFLLPEQFHLVLSFLLQCSSVLPVFVHVSCTSCPQSDPLIFPVLVLNLFPIPFSLDLIVLSVIVLCSLCCRCLFSKLSSFTRSLHKQPHPSVTLVCSRLLLFSLSLSRSSFFFLLLLPLSSLSFSRALLALPVFIQDSLWSCYSCLFLPSCSHRPCSGLPQSFLSLVRVLPYSSSIRSSCVCSGISQVPVPVQGSSFFLLFRNACFLT